jgi:hypothetical protein
MILVINYLMVMAKEYSASMLDSIFIDEDASEGGKKSDEITVEGSDAAAAAAVLLHTFKRRRTGIRLAASYSILLLETLLLFRGNSISIAKELSSYLLERVLSRGESLGERESFLIDEEGSRAPLQGF